MTLPLFSPDNLPEPPIPAEAAQSMPAGKPRLRRPIRDQVEMRWVSLDDLLEADHPVRIVWASVCTLNLKSWLGEIKAVEGHVGRDATDPRLLVALWVFATMKAVGSARELARLCQECLPYQWLCGGVSINYHLLSDFRSSGGEKWDELLTQIVATLMDAGLVKMDRIAQDGMRVRANAGKRLVSSPRYAGGVSGSGEGTGRDAQATGRRGHSGPDATAACRPGACRERATAADRRSDASVRGAATAA